MAGTAYMPQGFSAAVEGWRGMPELCGNCLQHGVSHFQWLD